VHHQINTRCFIFGNLSELEYFPKKQIFNLRNHTTYSLIGCGRLYQSKILLRLYAFKHVSATTILVCWLNWPDLNTIQTTIKSFGPKNENVSLQYTEIRIYKILTNSKCLLLLISHWTRTEPSFFVNYLTPTVNNKPTCLHNDIVWFIFQVFSNTSRPIIIVSSSKRSIPLEYLWHMQLGR